MVDSMTEIGLLPIILLLFAVGIIKPDISEVMIAGFILFM
ncbi:hypothetical protein DGWBC_1589 [Dehalogenimonas sp. WBC-2]|nr:hypothetical protein DGWBC_1589 [Dehalogenimonas sp. WBC-2]